MDASEMDQFPSGSQSLQKGSKNAQSIYSKNLVQIKRIMSSMISSVLQQLFPKTEFRCLNIGLDASGKTTILYKLKLGEIVTTIPTIGFNVETVNHGGASLTIWDVGGCDKIRPLWRHYYQNTQVLIFILDTNETDRFDEAMQLFRDTITAEALTNAVILCFLNKVDLCIGTSAEQVKERFLTASADILRNRTYHVEFSCAPSGEGLYEGLDWLVGALRDRPAADAATAQQARPREPTEKERLESQLEEWLSREDEPAEVFLDQLRDYTLDSWDHYTHLRIAYLLLSMHGRREGMQLIFRDIKSFIENSPRTRRGNTSDAAANRGTTFHETMTYFWVHMVHYAMESSRAPTEAFQSIPSQAIVDGGVSESSEVPPVPPSAWKVFLLMNPQLANGGLFLHYYSKQRMLLDPDARTMVLLPDKVPLPSLLVDVNSSNTAAASGVSADRHLPRAPLTDAHFLELLAQNKLPGWGHEVKLRVIYLLLCRWGGRSSKSVDGVLEVLQSIEKSGFHLTLSYFWIQMVTYHIAVEEREQKTAADSGDAKVAASVFSFSQQPTHTGAFGLQELQNALAQKEFNNATPTSGGEATRKCMAFADFLLRPHCQPLRNSELHSKYYSRKVLEAESAAFELALPDLKNLPSVV